jgi:hypothetical protein
MRVLSAFDTPTYGGRTPREWLLIGVAAGLLLHTVTAPRPYWINAALYAVALACAATRFYAARGLGVGTALSAWIQHWSRLLDDSYTVAQLPLLAWWPPLLLLLLSSKDLEARYERGPSAIRWLPNPWQKLPVWELRLLRWCAYAMGCQAGMLSLAWARASGRMGRTDQAVDWAIWLTACLAVVLLLLALGRPLALFAAPPLAAWTLVKTVPLLFGTADQATHHPATGVLLRSPEFVLPLAVTAAFSFTVALAYAVLLVQRMRNARRQRASVGALDGNPVPALDVFRKRG